MELGWESYTWDTEKDNITGVPVLNDCVYNRVINILSPTADCYKEAYPQMCIGVWKLKNKKL